MIQTSGHERSHKEHAHGQKMIYLYSLGLLWSDVCFYKYASDQEINLDNIFLPIMKTVDPRLLVICVYLYNNSIYFLKMTFLNCVCKSCTTFSG